MKNKKRISVLVLIFSTVAGIPALAFSQTLLKVGSGVWSSLQPIERSTIQTNYVLDVVADESYGTIIDNQGVDKSTPGTTDGARLGGAIASASYVDKSLDSFDYSAKGHLAAIILGGVIGTALDSKPQPKYHFRYTVRLSNGNLAFHDVFSNEPFRHPIGVCVYVPSITIVSEQHLCTQTADTLRQTYIASASARRSTRDLTPSKVSTISTSGTQSLPPPTLKNRLVNCRLNTLPPITTTAEKCALIDGVIIK